jgi:hypothetical protein
VNSSVSIVNRYWLDYRGSILDRNRNFLFATEYRPVLRLTQPPKHSKSGVFSSGRVPEKWSWPITYIYSRDQDCMELYIHFSILLHDVRSVSLINFTIYCDIITSTLLNQWYICSDKKNIKISVGELCNYQYRYLNSRYMCSAVLLSIGKIWIFFGKCADWNSDWASIQHPFSAVITCPCS